MKKLRRFMRWCVTDADGKIVIGQPANLPIMVGVLASIVTIVLTGAGRVVVGLIAYGALFTWAWMEIFQGATPLRRTGGGFVMVVLVVMAVLLLMAAGVWSA